MPKDPTISYPTISYPTDDDPTDEVPPFERLMRRHAVPVGPDVTIEEEIEREGIEDADPYAGFPAVEDVELSDPGGVEAAEPAVNELASLGDAEVSPLAAAPQVLDAAKGKPRRR